jgi:hypothetical protein
MPNIPTSNCIGHGTLFRFNNLLEYWDLFEI